MLCRWQLTHPATMYPTPKLATHPRLMLCPGGVQTCAQQTAVQGAKEAAASQDQDKRRWLVIDHLITLVGWRGISVRVVTYKLSLVLLQHYHFLRVSLRFDYASTGLTLLHEAHILLVGSGAFIAFLSDFYGGRQSEPRKIPWLVRLYGALYYPII